MKRYAWLLPLLFLFGLLAFPAETFAAASDAGLLWWTRVLPSLLPYLIAASLLVRSGMFVGMPKFLLPFALFGCGAIGGYPIGAKNAGLLYERGMLSERDAETAAMLTNLPNPVFLLSVVCIGFFGDVRTALPLLLGVYGTALLFAIPLLRLPYRTGTGPIGLSPTDLPNAIADGVRTVGVIGGCLVFASVLGALLFLPFQNSAASVLIGLFEMTCGIRLAASLPISLPLRLALCAAFSQFGGLSIFLQTHAQYPVRAKRYFGRKALAALLSAAATYALSLLLPSQAVPTMASGEQMLENTAVLTATTASAAVGLLLIFVFTKGLHKKN